MKLLDRIKQRLARRAVRRDIDITLEVLEALREGGVREDTELWIVIEILEGRRDY